MEQNGKCLVLYRPDRFQPQVRKNRESDSNSILAPAKLSEQDSQLETIPSKTNCHIEGGDVLGNTHCRYSAPKTIAEHTSHCGGLASRE